MTTQPSHQDLATRMDAFDAKLTKMLEELTEMKTSMVQVEHDVAKTKEIVEAWGAVKTVGKFVKWVASLGTGMVGIYVLAKAGLFHMIGK